MGKASNKYLFPIPEDCLLRRFAPAFVKLAQNQSATIVALPYTGRSALLRFTISQPKILSRLGVDLKKTGIYYVDIDQTNGAFESFLSGIITSLSDQQKPDPSVKQAILSQNSFLLSQVLFKKVKSQVQKKKIIFIVTLNKKAVDILAEIDNLFVQIQRIVGGQE